MKIYKYMTIPDVGLRHPKTTQLKKESQQRGNLIEIDGFKIKARAKKNSRNLPDAYDDILIDVPNNLSWKKLRKRRYK